MVKYLNKRIWRDIRIYKYFFYPLLFSPFILVIFIAHISYYEKFELEKRLEIISSFETICLGWIPVTALILGLFITNNRKFSDLLGKDYFHNAIKTVANSGFLSMFIIILSLIYRIIYDMLSTESQYWLTYAISFCFAFAIMHIMFSFARLANLAIHQLEETKE